VSNRRIILSTRNPGKLREIRQVLSSLPVRVVSLEDVCDLPEAPETGTTFGENARNKALYYARATAQWCLADDSGLQVDALDGQPGVNSARYARDRLAGDADRAATDRANNDKLLAALKGVDDADRTARFTCYLALADPQRVLIETSDTFEGRIARAPAGHNGFAYDPLFYLPQLGCTVAQLSPAEKNRLSHRGKAARKFAKLLESLLDRL